MGYHSRSCKMNEKNSSKIILLSLQDQVIAKHPPQYYIDGLQTYIRGANLVEKAATLVRRRMRRIEEDKFVILIRKRNNRLNFRHNYFQVWKSLYVRITSGKFFLISSSE